MPARLLGENCSRMELRKRLSFLALSLVVPLALYGGFAGRLITSHVGYEIDEAIYVESAVFVLRGSAPPPFRYDYASWLSTRGRRWPLMIIPYVGTTKAFVALPLFAIFGITAPVARWSGVLLGAVGIAGLVTLIGKRTDPIAGLIAGVALSIHPSYLDLTVFDNGGASVWMASMGLMCLALENHLRRQSNRSALLLGIAAGFGVWARANVLWLLVSVVAGALFAYGRRAFPPRTQLRAIALGACAGALPLILYEVGSRLATFRYIETASQPLSREKVGERLRELAELMISDGEQRGIWSGPPLPFWEIGIGAALLVAVLCCLFLPGTAESPAVTRGRRAFAISAVVLSAIMMASRLGIRQHHLVAVLPLALGALVILSLEAVRRWRQAIPLLAAAALGLALIFVSWDIRIDRGLRASRGTGVWSSAVDDVGRYLQSHPVAPSRLKILNWGFQSNLYVGSGGSVHGSELFWGATKARSSRGRTWESEIRDGGSFLLFAFPTGSAFLDAAAQGFAEALQKHEGPRRERRFLDRSGSPVALLIEIEPAAQPRL
jgi:hypothetical protein